MFKKTLGVLGASTVLILGGVAFVASAAELRAGEQPSLPKGTSINDDVYVVGGSITSSANVTGDFITAGGNILINGFVSEDLIAAGGDISILGNVGDDLRIAGGNITVGGTVGGDAVIGGGQVQITGDGIRGDLVWGGGVLQIDAPVQGDLKLGGGEVFINAPVTGNVEFHGDKLTLGSGAIIRGTLTYKTPKELTKEEGAQVLGEVIYKPRTVASDARFKEALAAVFSLAVLMGLLSRFVASLAFGLLLKRYSETIIKGALGSPLREIGRGFISLVAIPAAAIILLATVIGIPLGLLTIFAFLAFFIVAMIISPIVLGSFLHAWFVKSSHYQVNWKTILIGVFVYFILGFIPIVGWIIRCGFFLATVGAMVKLKGELVRDWR